MNESFTFICSSGLDFNPTQEQFIFGYLNEAFNTPFNYLVLWLKKFIWTSKFKSVVNLSVVGFKNYLYLVLSDLKKMHEKKNEPDKFFEWNDLFNILIESDTNEVPQHGLQVHQAQVHDLLLPAAPRQG